MIVQLLKIITELQEIKKLLQVIASNQEQDDIKDIKAKIQSEKEFYDKLITEMKEAYRTHAGISPDRISLVAKAGNRIADLWIDLI